MKVHTTALTALACVILAPAALLAQQPHPTLPAAADRPAGTTSASQRPASPDYVVGPKDVLAITVFNQPTLSGRFTVESDGTFAFPLVGRVNAGGLTLPDIERDLNRRLTAGYVNNPEITVAVDEFRSQRIFVVGEVRQPGPYPLTGRTTLIEVLALARSTTAEAAKEAIIVRPLAGTPATGPTMPDQAPASQVFHVDLNALEMGDLRKNLPLQDGDTIFVPRAATVIVFGQVRSPGVYPIGARTTLVHILAQAGGVTDRGATNRIRIVREVKGSKTEIKAGLQDLVSPGDTIIVPERLF